MSTVVQGMTTFLEWLFNLSSMIGLPYYGMAIILFTVIIKVLMYPLTWKQMTSMRKMTALQPKMKEIQKKYGKDKQKMNQKVMELYSKEKVSPYAGCLPILVQLPILWAFYRTLFQFPYGNDASVWFLGYNITVAYGLGLNYHLLLPLLAGATTYLMTKVSMATNPTSSKGSAPAGAEQTQKFMLIFMPFFLAYIVATVPSGLGIYILTMNVVSILQTIYINKKIAKEMNIKAAEEANNMPTVEETENEEAAEKPKRVVMKKKKTNPKKTNPKKTV